LRAYFQQQAGVSLPSELAFATEDATEEGRPDLVGRDTDGDRVLIVESKFWAALTSNQPAAYLRLLPEAKPGLMVVLSPATRRSLLWRKLLQASNDSGLALQGSRGVSPDFRLARIGDHHVLGLTSWHDVLAALSQAAESISNRDFAGDVAQLAGLCAQMDSEAFLPLHDDELSYSVGRRVKQFAALVDDVVNELRDKHGASTEGLKTGGGRSDYGRYFLLNGLACFFGYMPSLWAGDAETPMWLGIQEQDWSATPRIQEILNRAFPGQRIPVTHCPHVPVWLKTRAERREVVANIVDQIWEITSACAPERGGSAV
jgi:hypothetical protein